MKTHLSERLKRFLSLSISFLLIASISVPTTRAGSLDLTFGRDGKTTVDFPGSSSPNYSSIGAYVFTQPSGRIVGIGHHSQPGEKGQYPGVAAVGLTSYGVVDPGFSGGKILDWLGLTEVILHDARILPDGRIIRFTRYYTGWNNSDAPRLKRLTTDGAIDGITANLQVEPTPPPPPAFPISMNPIKFSVQNDGKILVLVRDVNWNKKSYIIRITAEGARDPSYGVNSVREMEAINRLPNVLISGMFALPNGKVVIGGTCGGPGNIRREIFFVRLNSDGNMDYSFGRKGMVSRVFSGQVTMPGMLVQGDKYLMAGSIQNSDIDLMMVRVNPNGRIDYGFGNNGVVTTDFTPAGSDFATAVALDANGRIVIAGEADQELASPSTFLVARYSADGVLEASTRTPFSPTEDAGARGLNIQPDGKIVAIGYTRNPNPLINGSVFAFARYTDITND